MGANMQRQAVPLIRNEAPFVGTGMELSLIHIFLDADSVKKLADLESREVLLAKLAGAMNGNLAKAVGLFAAPLSQAARALDALKTQKQAGDAPATDAAPAAEATTDAADAASV